MRNHFVLCVFLMAALSIQNFNQQASAVEQDPVLAGEEDATVSPDEKEAKPKISRRMNLALKTRGGTQFWTDHLHQDGYRVQQNVVLGHWRLLDASDVRRAWGTRKQCEQALSELRPKPSADETPTDGASKRYVILLHGLMRSHNSMKGLDSALVKQGNAHVIRFSYSSTRTPIADHAAALQEVLAGLPDDATFCFVGHSMGNIVARHLIGDLQQEGDPHSILERCECMVMLGPPNQGAAIARRLAPTGLFGMIAGKGGLQLGPNWADLEKHLGVPPFPFAIIAGDLSKQPVTNPLVDGSSDFVVSLEEAQLDGRESFTTVPVLHSVLMNDEATQQMVADFLKSH